MYDLEYATAANIGDMMCWFFENEYHGKSAEEQTKLPSPPKIIVRMGCYSHTRSRFARVDVTSQYWQKKAIQVLNGQKYHCCCNGVHAGMYQSNHIIIRCQTTIQVRANR